jgi:hypothetical protein
VFDDEIEVREIGRGIVDIVDVKRVTTQGIDDRPFVDMEVLNAEFLAEG